MRVLLIFLLFANSVQAQNTTLDLQGGVLKTDTILRKVTIVNGYIEANPYRQIFDTSVNIGSNVQIREVSAKWWGADPSKNDNSAFLQKAVFQSINRYPLFIPKGNYKYNLPLGIYSFYNNTFVGCTLKMYGESSFWGSTEGTTLTYTNTAGMALNLQLNKGTEISNLRLIGYHTSPGGADLAYFPTTFENYKQPSFNEYHTGVSIDPQGNPDGSNSGSTGIYIHDVTVSGFVTLFNITGGVGVLNGDNLIFQRIQLGDGRTGFQSGNAQAKGNVIRDCYGWGSLHTAFRFGKSGMYQSGSWLIENNSFAGRIIRLFDISVGGWFATTVIKVFAERIYQIGTISSLSVPISLSNCTFDFAYKTEAGERELLLTYYNQVVFRDCSFRYYGSSDTLKLASQSTFENCSWSGVKQYRYNTSLHINYGNNQFILSPK